MYASKPGVSAPLEQRKKKGRDINEREKQLTLNEKKKNDGKRKKKKQLKKKYATTDKLLK